MIDIIDLAFGFKGTLTARRKTDWIVLHHRAGSGDVMSLHAAHLANGWQGIGYHFYVKKDGTVFRGRPIDTVGAHVSGHNDHTIGICFEGNFEAETMPAEQLKAGAELIAHIQEGYGFALSVVCHRDLLATACPGKYFPAEAMIARAEAYRTAMKMKDDGIISQENVENWKTFLSGDVLCPSEYVETIIKRYQSKI